MATRAFAIYTVTMLRDLISEQRDRIMNKRNGRHNRIGSAIACTLLALTMLAPGAMAERVLILHAYHKSDWTDAINSGISSVLKSRPLFEPTFEYMDTKHFNSPDYLRNLLNIYQSKYARNPFDVIITSDNNAVNFALAHHDTLFHGAPIVFCGVNAFSPDMLRGHTNVTGVVEAGDFHDTLKAALVARPETARLLVIGDRTHTSNLNAAELRAVVQRDFPSLELLVADNMTLRELRQSLTNAPDDTLPFFISFWQEPNGSAIALPQLEKVLRSSAQPVFGRSEWLVGRGLCGGKCVRGFNQGKRAAQLAEQILNGTAAETIPVDENSPNAFMFDYNELSRHGISTSHLPDDAIILNEPLPVYQVPKELLIILLSMLGALSIAVVSLWMSQIRRQRTERLLRASEQRFRDLVETTSDIIWETDKQGRFTYVSPRVTPILGYQPEELLGHTAADFLTDGTSHSMTKILVPVHQPTAFEDAQGTAKHKDGSLVHVSVNGQPVFNSLRHFLGFRGVTHDVTRRREAEAMRRMTQFVLDHAVDATIWVDEGGRITYANQTACTWFGYSRDAFTEMAFEQIDPSFTADLWKAEWERLQDIPSDKLETLYVDSDGNDIPVEVIACFVAYEGRARVCFSIRNISERRAFEEQLRQSQKMESVGMLAGGIAHDFNNMLGGITGAAELLRTDMGDNPVAQKHISLILQASESAAQMTKQLLAFSRKGSVIYKPFDLHTVIHAALTILRHSIDRRIEIRTQMDATNTIIKGDSALLQNAILNLCINARDAMPEGGELTLTTQNLTLDEAECSSSTFVLRPGPFIQLTVSDTGIGMSPHTAERIFEPFFSTKESGFGTGLGLSAAYGTIQDLHGSIEVVTAPKRGTIFTIQLPLAGSIGAHEFDFTQNQQEPQKTDGHTGGCVLIVDDEAAIRQVLSTALTRAGYTILLACDGKEAVDIFEKEHDHIDLVLLDMLMPVMNGQECFRRMRAIDKNVCVVVQSGFSFEHEMDAMFEQGIRAFLRKPYRLSDIVETVKAAMAPPSSVG